VKFTDMQFLTIFFGAFLGTASAFALEAWRRYRDRLEQQFEGILAAQAVLLTQRNSLLSFIGQIQSNQNPFANLKYAILNFSPQSIDFSKLAFLGAASDPQLILELDVAQELYRNAINTAELRNKMLDEYLKHPGTRLENLDETGDKLRALGDPHLAKNVRQINELAWLAIQKAEKKNHETFNRLYKFARKQFPRQKKMPFAIPKTPVNTPTPPAPAEIKQ
jgi:hypothetical protein